MGKKKLAIVSYSFPPANSIGSRRWSEMLPTLAQKFEVFVFTVESEGDLQLPDGIKKIYRFHKTKKRDKGVSEGKTSSIIKIISMLRQGMRTVDSTLVEFFLKNRKQFLSHLDEIRPDMIITSIGPFSAACFGYLAKRNLREIKWVVDIRDTMSIYPFKKKNYLKRKVDEFIDRRIISRCDFIITVSESLSEIVQSFYNRRSYVIYNGFPLSDLNYIFDENQEEPTGQNIVYYGGKIYNHQLHAFKMLCNALQSVSHVYKLKMRLVDSDFREIILGTLKNYSFSYEILPAVDDETYKKECRESSILLLFENFDYQNAVGRGTLTGKLFNYFPLKAPVLSICRGDSDIGILLQKVNRGEVCDSEEKIVKFLQGKSDFYRGNEYLHEFSRENQANKLIRLLDTA